MTTAATHNEPGNTTEATLFVAFELSEKTWKLGFIAFWRFLETGGLTRRGGAQRGVNALSMRCHASVWVLVEATRENSGPAQHAVV
jgi:hypothetical protein